MRTPTACTATPWPFRAAGLIAAGLPEPEPQDGAGSYWAPTVAADRFVESVYNSLKKVAR